MNFTLSVRDINFIKPLFLYFNIFLISPWYNFERNTFYKTRLSKLYGCIIIFEKLFRIWHVVSNFKDTAGKFNNDLFALNFIQYIYIASILLSTFLIILQSTSWNITKWKTLITNLKYVDHKLGNVGRKATLLDNFYLKFLVEHLIFVIFAANHLFNWTRIASTTLLKGLYMGPIFEYYREGLVVIFINLLVACLRNRYEDLNERLKRSFTSPTFFKEVKTMTQIYRILGETIDLYNDIFGYQIILILFHFGMVMIACLNYIFMVMVNLHDYMYYRVLLSEVSAMVFVTCELLMIVLPMDSTIQEAKKFIDVCYMMQEQFMEGSQESASLTKLINSSKNFHRGFTAAGIFKIDKGIIFSLIGNVATYYIITIQFNEKQTNRNAN